MTRRYRPGRGTRVEALDETRTGRLASTSISRHRTSTGGNR